MRKLLLLAVAASLMLGGPAFAAQRATENRGAYDPSTDTTWVSAKAGVPLAITQAAGATTPAKAEDSASADGDVGVPALCVRKATPANTSGTDGDYEVVQCSAGRAWVSALIDTALPAGSNLIGQVTGSGTAGTPAAGVLTVQGITSMTNLKVDIAAQALNPITVQPSGSAGAAIPNGIVRVNAAASTNATVAKSSTGRLFGGKLCNAAAYDVFFKLYNKATAPTVGTDTPVWTLMIKAGTCQDVIATWGIPLNTGISYAITKLQADSDTTVVVAGDLTGYLVYG